jgi:hypothetical protein
MSLLPPPTVTVLSASDVFRAGTASSVAGGSASSMTTVGVSTASFGPRLLVALLLALLTPVSSVIDLFRGMPEGPTSCAPIKFSWELFLSDRGIPSRTALGLVPGETFLVPVRK